MVARGHEDLPLFARVVPLDAPVEAPRAPRLKPFFCYYGGKWRVARRYPAPAHDLIIEPFAGAAGYALRYPEHQVVLMDRDPVIAQLWRYLIHAPEKEIRALPLEVEDTATLDVCEGAKHLIGFWLNKGRQPCRTPGAWMRKGEHATSFWGPEIRERIASQVGAIRHWKILNGSFEELPDFEATWFVDPPYHASGRLYRYAEIDYAELGAWCRSRKGQVMVCEQEGAKWLPFRPFGVFKALESMHGKNISTEVIWENG